MSVGGKIYQLELCKNSIEWMIEHIDSCPDGGVILSERHETTRGRQGRGWRQFDGQLLLTILFKPESVDPEKLVYLNMAISLGVLHVLSLYNVQLKWPNDFMLTDKKMGGMLLKSIWSSTSLKGVVAGIGLNINSTIPQDDALSQIATSIYATTDNTGDLKRIQSEIFVAIDAEYERWKLKHYDEIFADWRNAQAYRGKHVQVHKKDGTSVSGTMKDVLSNGDLVLRDDSGQTHNISFCVVEQVQI